MILLSSTALVGAQGLLFTVNSESDSDDAAVGDSLCAAASGACTLRAAIQEANSHAGDDGIDFSISNSLNVIPTITLTRALPDLSTNLEIIGPGADKLVVRRVTSTEPYPIFKVTAPGVVTLSSMTIRDGDNNGIRNAGGGISNDSPGTLNIANCILTENRSTFGGGISNGNTGTVNVTNCTLSDNAGFRGGGGINNTRGVVNVTNCTLGGNYSVDTGLRAGWGGAFSIFGGTVNLRNSTISGNHAAGDAGFGGAVYIEEATVTIANCTLSGNSAEMDGGGIFNSGGTVQLGNSTLSGNSANNGGGFENVSSFSGGTTRVKSCIIALNTAITSGPDLHGAFTSQGFNLIGQNDGAEVTFPAGDPNANNDIVGTSASPVDPQLDPAGLQDNGGPTATIALRKGSSALDQGVIDSFSTSALTDQRGPGFPRRVDHASIANATDGDGTDIGAFELDVLPTPTPTPTPSATPTPPVTVLGNISTRLVVETGDNALIGGFIITGTQSKRLIVRAIGPSLALPGALADPRLELRDSSGNLLASNDNWKDTQRDEIEATTIPPAHYLESAIVATLPANNASYTAIVRGAGEGPGVGVVEAYDLDNSVDSQLANISTRGLVQTGDNVLIAGMIVLGQTPQKVVVRAIGPSLSVPGKLADPTLELRDSSGNILEANDNWQESPNKQAIIDSGIPPTHELESAIVATLPGNGASYTAIVRGVGGTTGIAVVEVYALE